MASTIQKNWRVRRNLGKLEPVVDLPNLIELQKESYRRFLQDGVAPDEREDVGLQGVFKSVFPMHDYSGSSSLEFVRYSLEPPKYDLEECRERGLTYAAPVKVVTRLFLWDINEETGAKTIRDWKEQEVYFGEIPLMTDNGTFIVNGTERVVVSQLHRSPGVFFDSDGGRTHSSGKLLYSARVIPYRGSWLDFEFDAKDRLYVRIDRRRKLLATVLLRALGYSTQELLDYFYDRETVFIEPGKKYYKSIDYDLLRGQMAVKDIRDPRTKEILVRKNRKFNERAIRKLKAAGISRLTVDSQDLVGRVAAVDVVDDATGEVLLRCNEEVTESKLEELRAHRIKQFDVLYIDGLNVGSYLRDTLNEDKMASSEDALLEIYRRMRPGDPPTIDAAKNFFDNLFFNPDRYDLSKVGRLKLNYKFKLDEPLDNTVLTARDILETVKYLIDLRNNGGTVDDIDHLGNRRVRAVGELLENQYRVGLIRMERAIRERMSMSQELETLMPHDLINAKPVSAVVKEYFGSSQLSQFMDQTNPLSEVTHKRRLSALGPGGLARERAGFEVRDVHATHYGRICPIETPEGPNIGLIASLSTYARVNDYGFIETPYRRVENGRATEDVVYLSALEEEGHYIAQANTPLNPDGTISAAKVEARYNGDFMEVAPEEVAYMDVSPSQLVSVAAALIPFLEHDDANRALMGSNMQRQGVPLVRTEAPLVGTGMEQVVARDSGVTVVAKRSGVVESVDAGRIVVRPDDVSGQGELDAVRPDIYNLVKYRRSNQNTCVNQKPIVQKGDRVVEGDVIADGPATDSGELALGQNVLVAFMPWAGYNFEDAILVSQRLVKEDVYTSVHIEEFECAARDTKLGKEEVTRDIPNVGEEALKDLDESGIVRIGAEVRSGDILVGKVTPKGETQLSPEEKLLRAIFGEKAGDVRDTSLKVPPGVHGIVIDAKVFTRRGAEKDERAKDIEDTERQRLLLDQRDETKIVAESYFAKMRKLLLGKTTAARLVDDKGKVLAAKGKKLDRELLSTIPPKYWREIQLEGSGRVEQKIEALADRLDEDLEEIRSRYQVKIEKLSRGDELPPGVIKMVKVFVAIKRKLSVGDKMAGRHGNKGVISLILPEEDMPYLEDGSPVDIVLNPLGVPSRMNVGQILETHLGWAARELGRQIDAYIESNWNPDVLRAQLKKLYPIPSAEVFIDRLSDDGVYQFAAKLRRGVFLSTPVFDGASEAQIKEALTMAGLPKTGRTILYDGKTGDAFDSDVTVGIMYMLKLHHLVDDKIHARSIGPYSLVTQQPLGGKAQFGGQRLGEMEVWAMMAYGAAYGLQEFLTVKSDDVSGRTRMYESIVKGDHTLEAGLPEAFHVLMKELQALCLNVELIEESGQAGTPSSGEPFAGPGFVI